MMKVKDEVDPMNFLLFRMAMVHNSLRDNRYRHWSMCFWRHGDGDERTGSCELRTNRETFSNAKDFTEGMCCSWGGKL